jgi:hypothetical protein
MTINLLNTVGESSTLQEWVSAASPWSRKSVGGQLCLYIVICLEINVKEVRHRYELGTRDGDRHAAGTRASRSSTELDS